MVSPWRSIFNKMKILVYTCSDFSPYAKECIDLLYASIYNKNKFDFAVVTNNLNAPKTFNIIYDDSKINFVVDLRYSSKLPKDYDRYIYLDSDILFYGDVELLYDSSKEHSIVTEPTSMAGEWYSYPFSDSLHKEKESKLEALNSGTFSFTDTSFLSEVREFLSKDTKSSPSESAKFEQACYNYAMCKKLNYDFSKAHKLNDFVQLFAQYNPVSINKKLYHFNGFSGNMVEKYRLMVHYFNVIKALP